MAATSASASAHAPASVSASVPVFSPLPPPASVLGLAPPPASASASASPPASVLGPASASAPPPASVLGPASASAPPLASASVPPPASASAIPPAPGSSSSSAPSDLSAFMKLQSAYPINGDTSSHSFHRPEMFKHWVKWYESIVQIEPGKDGHTNDKQRRQGLLHLRYFWQTSEQFSTESESIPYDSWILADSNPHPRFPDLAAITSIKEAVDLFTASSKKLVTDETMEVRRAIQRMSTTDTTRFDYFQGPDTDQSIIRYSHTIKAMLVFLYRVVISKCKSHVKLDSFITVEVKQLVHECIPQSGKISEDYMIRLLSYLFSQKTRSAVASGQTLVIPAMVAILSINSYGEMTAYNDISHVAVHFICFARLTCLQCCVRDIEGKPREEHDIIIQSLIDEMASDVLLNSTFSHVSLVKSLAMSLIQHGNTLPSVTYDSVSKDIISVEGVPVSLAIFQKV
ncbi:hypothetical protein GGI05_005897, partial [Coemansia sp. RSA 2603]